MSQEALGPGRHAFTTEPADGERLDLLVARMTGLSRTQAATLIATGKVTLDGAAARASVRPEPGVQLVVEIPVPPGREIVAERIPIRVVFEDDELVVVDKDAGMVVHPAPGNWSGTLVNALMGRGQGLAHGGAPERAGLVHRLDKETSGLLIVAKTDRAHRTLSAALAARHVTRRYVALIGALAAFSAWGLLLAAALSGLLALGWSWSLALSSLALANVLLALLSLWLMRRALTRIGLESTRRALGLDLPDDAD
jgi:hypothetical protein